MFMSTDHVSTGIYIFLTIVIAALVVIHYYMQSLRIIKMGKKLPGPPPVPFFGNALIPLGVKPKDALYKLLQYEGYGNVIRAFFGTKCIVFIMDPRDVEIILGSSVHIDKSPEYKYFAPWLGDGLLISTGKKWRTHRKIIAPTFHLNVLKTFVPYFYENSQDLVNRLRSEVGSEFDCHDLLSTVTVDILLGTAMGVRGRKNKTSFAYAKAVMKMCDIIHRRQYDVRLRFNSFFKFSGNLTMQKNLLGIIHGLTSNVIRTKKQEYLDKVDVTISCDKTTAKSNDNKKSISLINTKANQEKMRYVRDDLDEIDENDVGKFLRRFVHWLSCNIFVHRIAPG